MIESFKKCGIGNTVDWTEEDILFVHNIGSIAEMSDTVPSDSESNVDVLVFKPNWITAFFGFVFFCFLSEFLGCGVIIYTIYWHTIDSKDEDNSQHVKSVNNESTLLMHPKMISQSLSNGTNYSFKKYSKHTQILYISAPCIWEHAFSKL